MPNPNAPNVVSKQDPNRFEFVMLAKSPNRTLTKVTYPGITRLELVQIQAIVSKALIAAGFQLAAIEGEEVPPEMLVMFGMDK